MRTLRSGALNYDTTLVSRETGVFTDESVDPSRTIQSGKDEADINVIVRRFGVTGTVVMPQRLPEYADYDDVFDYQTAMNVVRTGNESFNALPAEIRRRFNNDPQEFLAFCSDEKNLDDLRKMGLAKPAPIVDTTPAPGVPAKENGDVKSGTAGS